MGVGEHMLQLLYFNFIVIASYRPCQISSHARMHLGLYQYKFNSDMLKFMRGVT
jgi:hypothetical protein